MKNILKRITPVKRRLRRVMSRESTVKHVILTVGFLPAEDVQVYTCLFKSDLVNAFTSLGIDLALAVYLFQGNEGRRS